MTSHLILLCGVVSSSALMLGIVRPFALVLQIALGILVTSNGHSQTLTQPPQAAGPSGAPQANSGRAFEVASIRESVGPGMEGESSYSGPTLTLSHFGVVDLVVEAYGVKRYQVSNQRSQMGLYDIVAKAGGSGVPTRAEFRQMLQSLLADRFKLQLHRSMKEMPVYALVVAKNGPKLRESGPDESAASHGVPANRRNRIMRLKQANMDLFVQRIMELQGLDRPVVNETGLEGKYTFEVEATLPFLIAKDPQPDDISFFRAIEDQLGLKLEGRNRPMEILIVDHIERPSGN